MGRVRGSVVAVLPAVFLVTLLAPPAFAAVSISRAELSGSKLRVEGGGATPNTGVAVNGGAASSTSDGSGAYRIEHGSFAAPADCKVVVSDGATSATATLSGCTPTSSTSPSAPPAPAPLGPGNGASVLAPFTLSWSAVADPSGIAGYNWQISTSSSFSPVTRQDSTSGTVTQDTISGLPVGTYFWRVQAVNGNLVQGAWSQTWSFTVRGATSAQLEAPAELQLVHGTQYHPFESMTFTWSAVEGAAGYFLEASKDSTFPALSTVKIDNIPGTTTGLVIGDFCNGCEQGDYFARVYAVDANRDPGLPSSTIGFSISYDAPLPPPPTPLAPADGATVRLPVTLDWSDVPNPQPSGYEAEVSRDSSFTDIEEHIPQLNNSARTVLSLTSGTKFWRARSHQGMASPTTTAATAWSTAFSFTIPDEAPAVASVALAGDSLFSGQEIVGEMQLTTAAPAGGAVVSLTSSDPTASGTMPASVTVPAGFAYIQFRLHAGQVTEPTEVTLTATLDSSSASFVFTVHPPSLKELSFCCGTTGGVPAGGSLTLNGRAPAGGALVSLESDSSAASPPATITVPEGDASAPVSIPTSAVATTTTVTISATWNGLTVQAQLTLTSQEPPSSLFLDRASTTGQEGASGTVRIASARPHDVQILLGSSHPEIARVPEYVRVPAGVTAGGFLVFTQPPAASTDVTISASGAGVTLTAPLTVHGFAASGSTSSADSVSISRAEYDGAKGELRVEASSSSSSATLRAYVSATNELIGTLSGGKGQFSWPVNPQDVTVRSTLGGSATRAVTSR